MALLIRRAVRLAAALLNGLSGQPAGNCKIVADLFGSCVSSVLK
jgi:hypothetical protein